MSGITFTATAYDSAIVLNWFAGAGSPESTPDQVCEVTIQYHDSDISSPDFNVLRKIWKNSLTHRIPNTPPYVVRELQQPQMTNNLFYHPGLVNDHIYSYSIFVHYMDTGVWEGPTIASAIPLVGLSSPLVSGSLSYSKLSTNTKLRNTSNSLVSTVVWLSEDQEDQKTEIESVINQLKPAHVQSVVAYEPYYIAQTTAVQFNAGSYASGSYSIVDSTLINKIPTIDYSFSGKPEILGES